MSVDNGMALDGTAAPPQANGEIVFEELWQARVFGMARALCEKGYYDWDEFRQYLIAEIGGPNGDLTPYFEHFLAALARLVDDKSICDAGELMERFEEIQSLPHGHDH